MIYSDFMRSLRYGNEWYKQIDSGAYYRIYEQVISQMLSRSGSLVRLACLTEDLDTCLGWCLTDGERLHYIFVKKDQRNQGIARSLMPKNISTITHLTKAGQPVWKKKIPHAIFNPFLI